LKNWKTTKAYIEKFCLIRKTM